MYTLLQLVHMPCLVLSRLGKMQLACYCTLLGDIKIGLKTSLLSFTACKINSLFLYNLFVGNVHLHIGVVFDIMD